MKASPRIRPFAPLYRVSLGFTILWTFVAVFMILRPIPVMQILFAVGGVNTLQHSRSMAAGFSRYVFIAGFCLMGLMIIKSFLLWLWFRKRIFWGLILYVFLNLCLIVLSQYAAINYYGFFYTFVSFPVLGILIHLLTLQPAADES